MYVSPEGKHTAISVTQMCRDLIWGVTLIGHETRQAMTELVGSSPIKSGCFRRARHRLTINRWGSPPKLHDDPDILRPSVWLARRSMHRAPGPERGSRQAVT